MSTNVIFRKQLLTGEELYVVDNERFVCKKDYLHKNLNGKWIKYSTVQYSTVQ